jgi:hypothetical protein
VRLDFIGDVWSWRGPAPYHFVTVPDPQAAEIEAVSGMVSYGWGMVPVAVRLGDTEWRTALFPKDGGYVLPLKDAVRRAEDVEIGDTVQVRLSIDVGAAGRRRGQRTDS